MAASPLEERSVACNPVPREFNNGKSSDIFDLEF
jgi:hypothetical protein